MGRLRGGMAIRVFASLGFSLAFLSSCGQDASIRLTRPEVEPVKTKTIHFSLDAAEEGKMGAEIQFPGSNLQLQSAGLRSFDVPIGQNVDINIKLNPGWEIESVTVVPGGNVDYDKTKTKIRIKNVQNEMRVSASVRRILAIREKKRVTLTLVAPDAGDVSARVSGEGVTSFQLSPGVRTFDVPMGADLSTVLSVPEGYEVVGWQVAGRANYADPRQSTSLLVQKIDNDLAIAATVRRSVVAIREKKKVSFSLVTPDGGKVSAQLTAEELGIIPVVSGVKTFEVPVKSALSVKLELPKTFKVEKWEIVGRASYADPKHMEYLELKDIADDLNIAVTVKQVEKFKLQFRIAGTGFEYDKPGSGSIHWQAWKSGDPAPQLADFMHFLNEDLFECDTFVGIDKLDENHCKAEWYKPGSSIAVWVVVNDKNGHRTQEIFVMTIDDDTQLDFDFHAAAGLDLSGGDIDIYQSLKQGKRVTRSR